MEMNERVNDERKKNHEKDEEKLKYKMRCDDDDFDGDCISLEKHYMQIITFEKRFFFSFSFFLSFLDDVSKCIRNILKYLMNRNNDLNTHHSCVDLIVICLYDMCVCVCL